MVKKLKSFTDFGYNRIKHSKNIRENPSHPWSRNKTTNVNTSYDKKAGIQNY